MDKNTWEKIESLFDAALAVPIEQQSGFVKEYAKGNDVVFSQVMGMLKAHDNTFMDSSPVVVSNPDDLYGDELSTLGHFKIIKKIATGGMGRVYLAQTMNTDVDVFVALKTIRIELISQDLEKRFFNEKQILSKLKHKNIASLVDAGVAENKIPYIATEWVEGQIINKYCIEQNLSLKARLKLFLQICSAVSFAHNKLIIHRDLKPDNILVDKNGQVKLLDFGIAKIIDDNQDGKTQTQIFTPDYAAPEQINGHTCGITTDVYALGVILFELISNSKRFDLAGLTIGEKIDTVTQPKAIDFAKISTLKALPYSLKNIKGPLINIINKAMHVDTNRRYENVPALMLDVNNYLNKRPVSAMKDNFFYKTKMFLFRNKLASVLSFMILMAIGSGLYLNNQQIKLKLQEAEKSQAMSAFFSDILNSATPAHGGSLEMTVREMFETGIAKFDFDGLEKSSTKAEIAAEISLIYTQLSNEEQAKYYNDIAINYYQNNLDSINNVSAYLFYSIREVAFLVSEKKYQQALELNNMLLKEVEGLSVDDESMSLALMYMGKIYSGQWEHRDAKKGMEYFNQAAVLAKTIPDYDILGQISYYKYSNYSDEISNQEAMKRLNEAESNFKKSKAGELNQNLTILISDKATILFEQGRLAEAGTMYEESIRLHRSKFGLDDFSSLVNKAQNELVMGKFDKASGSLTKAEETFIQQKLAKNINYYGLLLYKAAVLTETEDFVTAGKMYQEVYGFMQNLLPDDHRILKVVKNFLADYYLKANESEGIEKSQVFLQQLISNKDTFGVQKELLKITSLINLANIYLYKQEYEQAWNYYQQANELTSIHPEKYQQMWLYWQMKTGRSLTQATLGDLSAVETFNFNKSKLLEMVSHDQWYNDFFQLPH